MQKRYPYEIINKLRSGENNLLISKVSQEIEHLKEQFDDTDYKTMKNLQYEAMGKDLHIPGKTYIKQLRKSEYRSEKRKQS